MNIPRLFRSHCLGFEIPKTVCTTYVTENPGCRPACTFCLPPVCPQCCRAPTPLQFGPPSIWLAVCDGLEELGEPDWTEFHWRRRQRIWGGRHPFDRVVASVRPLVTAWQKCIVSLLLSPTTSMGCQTGMYTALFHSPSRCSHRRQGGKAWMMMLGQRSCQTCLVVPVEVLCMYMRSLTFLGLS